MIGFRGDGVATVGSDDDGITEDSIEDATDNRFLRLSTAEGVSQTKVDSIVQDDAGFMWFGTHFGLYRYDGYAFKVFARDPDNPHSLDCIDVQALFNGSGTLAASHSSIATITIDSSGGGYYHH